MSDTAREFDLRRIVIQQTVHEKVFRDLVDSGVPLDEVETRLNQIGITATVSAKFIDRCRAVLADMAAGVPFATAFDRRMHFGRTPPIETL